MWKVGVKIVDVRQQSEKLREELLLVLAEIKQTVYNPGDHKVQGFIKAMQNTEKMRQKFTKLRNTKHPRELTETKIQIPWDHSSIAEMWDTLKTKRISQNNLEWQTVEEEEQVTNYLLEWCVQHFGQSRDTPLATKEWRLALDPELAGHILEK